MYEHRRLKEKTNVYDDDWGWADKAAKRRIVIFRCVCRLSEVITSLVCLLTLTLVNYTLSFQVNCCCYEPLEEPLSKLFKLNNFNCKPSLGYRNKEDLNFSTFKFLLYFESARLLSATLGLLTLGFYTFNFHLKVMDKHF